MEIIDAEWKETTEDVVEHPSSDPAPEEPTSLITPEKADSVVEEKSKRQEILLNAKDEALRKSREEIAERYKLGEGNVLTRFIRQTKAIFAGEFSDLKISENLAEASPENQQRELGKAFRLIGRDGALRLGKVAAKTGVAGGIGAGIAAVLGGTIGSPVFLAALAGGAATRGAFELYRHFKKDEREGRSKVIESRSKVLAEAANLQVNATALYKERETANDERIEEIDQQLEDLHTYLIDLTRYESYQALYANNDPEKELETLARVNNLGHEKMRLEKKREKIADLVAAGGSLLGGMVGHAVQSSLLATESVSKQTGFWADFDKDGVKHFVQRVNIADVVNPSPEFAQQLERSGGFVFNYSGGSAMAEHGAKIAAQVTEGVLSNGSSVHVINGLNESVFKNLILQGNPQIARDAAIAAGSIWKEAVPIAAGHLLMMADFFSTTKKKEGEDGTARSAKPSTDAESRSQPELPGVERKALPGRKKPEDEDEATVIDSQPTEEDTFYPGRDAEAYQLKEDMSRNNGNEIATHERDAIAKLRERIKAENKANKEANLRNNSSETQK
ncbi:MAG: hypothetical protein NUV80_03960, partial [Candidatus Berkelbacteria bacterium]|nr:hypothetical protein [Candidatus Berkelbacteria bacterium]